MLLTGNDLRQTSSQTSLLNTMSSLLRMKVVPVLNGNDVVAPNPVVGSDLYNVRACGRVLEGEGVGIREGDVDWRGEKVEREKGEGEGWR